MAFRLGGLLLCHFRLIIDQIVPRILAEGAFRLLAGLCAAMILITGCSLPQVSAESRLFLNLSLAYLADYQLPQTKFKDTTVGGFSALTYDRQRDRIYALADDSTQPRVYTLKLSLPDPGEQIIPPMTVEEMTLLVDPHPSERAVPSLKSGGIALTPSGTVFVTGERDAGSPRLSEFQLNSGSWQQDLPLPQQYGTDSSEEPELGIQPHHGLKALTLSTDGDRLFAATESPLSQDVFPTLAPATSAPDQIHYSRLLHYWIGVPEPILIAEHLYPLDPTPTGHSVLTDMIPVDHAGHFLGLERSYQPETGYSATIYQFVTGVATDSTGIRILSPNAKDIVPIMKRPLLHLSDLKIPLENIEGMMLGPHLKDGAASVMLVSNNGLANTPTQFLLFRLETRPQSASMVAVQP